MVEITATKTFNFACAHLLSGHAGLCKNLHGHNYKVEVTFAPKSSFLIPIGPSRGMVCDFKDIKNLCNTHVFDKYDHAFVVQERVLDPQCNYTPDEEAEFKLAQVAVGLELKTVAFPLRPTAENMALVFLKEIDDVLDTYYPEAKCINVRVWETDSSYADANSER